MIEKKGGRSFEDIKHVNEHGAEYWHARELQPLLGYGQWRSFEKAIAKAIASCKQSGNEPGHHFARAQNGRAGFGYCR
jgi:DNA-damage-inducible protein D